MSYKERAWLIQKKITEGMINRDIGKLEGVSESTIRYWLKKYDITSTSTSTTNTSIRAVPIRIKPTKMSRKERKRQKKALKRVK